MIHFKKITLREIHLPLKEPFRISSGTEDVRRIFLLQFTNAGGAETWSECCAGAKPNYSYETIDTAWLAIKSWCAPRVLNKNFDTPQALNAALRQDFRGHNMAKAVVEMAGWALAAQLEGIPLAKKLGGERRKIATGISLGIQETPAILVQKVQKALADGYQKVKMKIKPGQDLDFVAVVRRVVGEMAPLMVDANNAYTIGQIEFLKKFDQFNLMMIEQPLAHDDIFQHSKLQPQMATPVCLDESITNLEKAHEMVALGSGRIINIKPGRVGGFTEAIAIHDFCRENNIPVWCGGMLESGIGRAYNVALASLPNFTLPGDVSPSARYWARDIVTPEWTMNAAGLVTVPWHQPGLGIKIDIDRIEKLTVRQETLN
jgi:O-succinylbenzoate synthase